MNCGGGGDGFIYNLSLFSMLRFICLVVPKLGRSPPLGGFLTFLSFRLCFPWLKKKKNRKMLKFNLHVKCFEISDLLISLASLFYILILLLDYLFKYTHTNYIWNIYIFTLNVLFKKISYFNMNINLFKNNSFISLIYFKYLLFSV